MSSGQESDQAPPRRLANALEELGRAVRHIADVRSGGDLLLEALDAAAMIRGQETGGKKASDGIQRAADVMRKALDDLRATGNILIVDNYVSVLSPHPLERWYTMAHWAVVTGVDDARSVVIVGLVIKLLFRIHYLTGWW